MAEIYRSRLGYGLPIRSYSCDGAPDATASRIMTIYGLIFMRPAASEKSKVAAWKRKTYLFPLGPRQLPDVISLAAATPRVHPTSKLNNPNYFGLF
jgi:hypothetical protein